MTAATLYIFEGAPPAPDFRVGRYCRASRVRMKGEDGDIVSFLDSESEPNARPLLRMAVMNGFPVGTGNSTTFFGEIVGLDQDRLHGRLEFFDNGNNKFKEATYQYKFSGKYWYAEVVIMTDLKKEHSTTIELKDVKFDQGLSDDEFTVESLVPPKEEKEE